MTGVCTPASDSNGTHVRMTRLYTPDSYKLIVTSHLLRLSISAARPTAAAAVNFHFTQCSENVDITDRFVKRYLCISSETYMTNLRLRWAEVRLNSSAECFARFCSATFGRTSAKIRRNFCGFEFAAFCVRCSR